MRMNLKRAWISVPIALMVASCGGGSSGPELVATNTLTSVALSPLTVTLADGGTQQLTVTGTFSNGTTQTLTSGETFASSASSVATVNATGLVTVAANATPGATATITVTDTASGIASASAASTVVTVVAGPTANSVSAAMATVKNNAKSLDVSNVNIPFLNFTSGFTFEGNYPPTTPCPTTGTVDGCLAGLPTTPNPADVGAFYYDSDHMEEDASLHWGLGSDGILKLQSDIQAVLGSDLTFAYSIPMLAAGVYTTSDDYTAFLRKILAGQYQMSQTLSANKVCTNWAVSGCNAIVGQSPITTASNEAEAWSYSMGHWIEDDPKVGDGSFSSAGALGWYPWIDKTQTYYGIIARADLNAAAGDYEGYESAVCGRLIRNAFITGEEQTGADPVFPSGIQH
jgi:hypothetical protein